MFKDYLRIRSRGFQLAVFLFIWAGLYLVAVLLQMLLIRQLFHIGNDGLSDFVEGAITQHPNFVIVSNALYSLLVFGVPAFLFAYLAHPKPAAYLGLRRPSASGQWVWAVVVALALVPLLMTVGGLVNELNLGAAAKRLQEFRESQINAYLKSTDAWGLLRNILFLALLPAFCEELFFRGVVQRFAYAYWKKAGGAVLISAFAFALMHRSLYDFLPIFMAGLVLGWLYQQSRSLWLNVTVHLLFNGLQVVIAYYAVRYEVLNRVGEDWLYMGVAALVALLILTIALIRLYRLRSPFPKTWGVEEPQAILED